MRCLALEKVLESHEQKFEYLGDGKYKFWDSHSVRTEYCGPAEYQDEYENSLEKSIDAYYVKYEKLGLKIKYVFHVISPCPVSNNYFIIYHTCVIVKQSQVLFSPGCILGENNKSNGD